MKARKRESHLLQMRGLKQMVGPMIVIGMVASFTDAWIETVILVVNIGGCEGRIFYRCVD